MENTIEAEIEKLSSEYEYELEQLELKQENELKQIKTAYETEYEKQINDNKYYDYNHMCDKIMYKCEKDQQKINNKYDTLRKQLKNKYEHKIKKLKNKLDKKKNEYLRNKQKIQKKLREEYLQDKNIFPFFESKCYFWYTNSCLIFKTLNENIDFETDVVIAKYTNSTVLPLNDDDKEICEKYGFKIKENLNELETFIKEYDENQKKDLIKIEEKTLGKKEKNCCRPLSHDEIQKMKQHFLSSKNKNAIRDYTLIFLGLHTGFKISELLSIKLKNIYDIKTNKVTDHVSHYTKENSIERTVPLNNNCKDLLIKYINKYNLQIILHKCSETYLFPSNRNVEQPLTTRQGNNIFKRAYSECGFTGKLACHTTRKTFAIECSNKLDRNIFDLQQCLGHKSITSTQNYIEINNDRIDNAILTISY